MAPSAAEIQLGSVNSGRPYRPGVLHDMFGQGVVGAATDYALVEIRNLSTTPWVSVVAWLTLDTGGGAVSIAIADATPRDVSYESYAVSPAGLTYSTPTSKPTALAVGTIPAGQKVLLAIRRVLAGATPDYPESNVLNLSGT